MQYIVALKSGVIIELYNLSKQDVDIIRIMPQDETLGFGLDGAFIQRSEIAAITKKNGLESVNAVQCLKCNGTGYQKSLSPSGIEFQCEICTNCGGTGVIPVR